MEKKRINLKVLFFVIVLVAILSVVIFYKSIDRKVYTKESFTKVLEKYKYKVEDKSNDYYNDKSVETYLLGTSKDELFRVDFFIMKDEKASKKYYKELKEQLEKETGMEGTTKTNKIGYSKYIMEASNNYVVVVKSDETIIFINTNNKNKDKVEKLIKKLGY